VNPWFRCCPQHYSDAETRVNGRSSLIAPWRFGAPQYGASGLGSLTFIRELPITDALYDS
jgi:hypothetical protein